MRFVYVIEDDKKFQQQIADLLLKIEGQLQVRFFNRRRDFVAWLKKAKKGGFEVLSQGGYIPTSFKMAMEPRLATEESRLVLIISKGEILPSHRIQYLDRIIRFLVAKKFCTDQEPTQLMLTRFESGESHPHTGLSLEQLKNSPLNNLIYKPFDKLILEQDLTFALVGHRRVKQTALSNHKTSAQIEMLKEVVLTGLSEVGFLTLSTRKMELGIPSKYYGKRFTTDAKKWITARLVSQEPIPGREDQFLCNYSFFALDRSQLSVIRKLVKDKSQTFLSVKWASNLLDSSKRPIKSIVIIDKDSDVHDLFKFEVQKKFPDLRLIHYESLADFYYDLDPSYALEQQGGGEKLFSENAPIEIQLDYSGTQIFRAQVAVKKITVKIFGIIEKDYRSKGWLIQYIPPSFKEVWKKWLHEPVVPFFLPLRKEEHFYLAKITQAASPPDGGFLLTAVEATKEEQKSWLLKNSKLPPLVDGIFANHAFFSQGTRERIEKIKKLCHDRYGSVSDIHPPPPAVSGGGASPPQAATPSRTENHQWPLFFFVSSKNLSVAEERSFPEFIVDFLPKPLDLAFLYQKLILNFPSLKSVGDPIVIPTVKVVETIKTGNTITLKEISESDLTLEYPREIAVGDPREFLLSDPSGQKEGLEILARCNFCEENKDLKNYACHFVFFGITDLYLKAIRLWIRNNYIQSKNKD